VVAESVTRMTSFSTVGRVKLVQDENRKITCKRINNVMVKTQEILLAIAIEYLLYLH